MVNADVKPAHLDEKFPCDDCSVLPQSEVSGLS